MKTGIIISLLILVTGCAKDKSDTLKKTSLSKTGNSSWNNVKASPGSGIDYLKPKKINC